MKDKMKFYVYISKTKVDMLYQQIPQPLLKGFAAELKVDLKLLAAEISTTIKKDANEEAWYSKLQIVVSYIERHLDVGTIDDPKTFFKGSLPMYWGSLGGAKEVVYFAGQTEQTALGLGGSFHHVIGNDVGTQMPIMSSAFPQLVAVLAKELNISVPSSNDNFWNNPSLALRAVKDYSSFLTSGAGQHLEFLAKTYLREVKDPHSKPAQVLLGSPIYVASN
jgi:hypothetical protein